MKYRSISRALCLGVAAALLAGCGGSQPPNGALGVMPQSRIAARQADRSPRPHGYNHTLLYATSGEAVYVYHYPKGNSRTVLGYFGSFYGACVDKAGDIFLSTAEGLYEYAHDGASPIATLNASGACSVDPVTGNLAVCSGPIVSVYPYSAKHGWLLPKERIASFNVRNCGYDNQGNLFVAGIDTASGGDFRFAELPAKSRTFNAITLDQNISGPGHVQWDGNYITIEDTEAQPSVLYRFSISGSAGHEVGSTVLNGPKTVYQLWIQGNKVAGSTSDSSVDLWGYPAGGSPINKITLPSGAGVVTVSAAPHH